MCMAISLVHCSHLWLFLWIGACILQMDGTFHSSPHDAHPSSPYQLYCLPGLLGELPLMPLPFVPTLLPFCPTYPGNTHARYLTPPRDSTLHILLHYLWTVGIAVVPFIYPVVAVLRVYCTLPLRCLRLMTCTGLHHCRLLILPIAVHAVPVTLPGFVQFITFLPTAHSARLPPSCDPIPYRFPTACLPTLRYHPFVTVPRYYYYHLTYGCALFAPHTTVLGRGHTHIYTPTPHAPPHCHTHTHTHTAHAPLPHTVLLWVYWLPFGAALPAQLFSADLRQHVAVVCSRSSWLRLVPSTWM